MKTLTLIITSILFISSLVWYFWDYGKEDSENTIFGQIIYSDHETDTAFIKEERFINFKFENSQQKITYDVSNLFIKNKQDPHDFKWVRINNLDTNTYKK